MIAFDAEAVAFERDEDFGVAVLVLAEHQHASGRRVELQRALVVTDEDRRLGMDTYSLAAESGATHYGGVESSTFSDGVLERRLDPDAAQALGVEGGFRIRLADPERSVEAVTYGLRDVLR